MFTNNILSTARTFDNRIITPFKASRFQAVRTMKEAKYFTSPSNEETGTLNQYMDRDTAFCARENFHTYDYTHRMVKQFKMPWYNFNFKE